MHTYGPQKDTLFYTSLRDGCVLRLVAMPNGGIGLIRDGEMIVRASKSEREQQKVIDRFFELRVRDQSVGHSRPEAQVV